MGFYFMQSDYVRLSAFYGARNGGLSQFVLTLNRIPANEEFTIKEIGEGSEEDE